MTVDLDTEKTIVYQNERNYGTVKSANGAIRKTSGNFVKLLAADDALYDECSLSYAAEALLKSSSGIITGDVMRCDENLKPVAKYRNNLCNSSSHAPYALPDF